jgi:hypothetical protein
LPPKAKEIKQKICILTWKATRHQQQLSGLSYKQFLA